MREVMFVQIGIGVDLQGQDVTKAATRAVRDAIGRNYLPEVRRRLEGGAGRMLVHVRLGVPAGTGGGLDHEAVRRTFPYGEVTVEPVEGGGMLVPSGLGDGGSICTVTAAVEVGVEP